MKCLFARTALVAAMFCSLASTAQASSAFAEISGLRFDLVDLDANDGVTPWFDLRQVSMKVEINDETWYPSKSVPGSREDQTIGRQALANWDFYGGHLQTSAVSGGPQAQGLYSAASLVFSAEGGSSIGIHVSLSPQTRLDISGTAHVSVTGEGWAYAGYQLYYDGSDVPIVKKLVDVQRQGLGTESKDLDLSFSVINNRDHELRQDFAVFSTAVANAVPESQTTLLAGFGVLVALATARRRNGSQPERKG